MKAQIRTRRTKQFFADCYGTREELIVDGRVVFAASGSPTSAPAATPIAMSRCGR